MARVTNDDQRVEVQFRQALRRLKRLGDRRVRLQQRTAELQAETLAEVRAARALRLSAPAIARELGISHQAVYQMLEERTDVS